MGEIVDGEMRKRLGEAETTCVEKRAALESVGVGRILDGLSMLMSSDHAERCHLIAHQWVAEQNDIFYAALRARLEGDREVSIIVRESDDEVVAAINPKTYALTGCNDERLADQIETLAVERRPLSELDGYQLVESTNGNPEGTD